MVTNGLATSTLSKEGHTSGVTTEGGNVLLDPAQSELLVAEPIIALHVLAVVEEAKCPEAIVEANENDLHNG